MWQKFTREATGACMGGSGERGVGVRPREVGGFRGETKRSRWGQG